MVHHRRLRLSWARQHFCWSRCRWNRVLVMDELHFNLQFIDGRLQVWRKTGGSMDENNMVEWDRYGGGSVMIWGGILVCHGGKTELVPVNGCLKLINMVMKSSSRLRFLLFREEELTFCSKTTLAAMLLVTQRSALLQQSNI